MNIALFELSEPMHYMVIHGLIKTYSVNPNHTIDVYVTNKTNEYIKQNNYAKHVTINICEPNTEFETCLERFKAKSYDRIHLCTVSGYFTEFKQITSSTKAKVYFHIHNIDVWFKSALLIYSKQMIAKIKSKENISSIFNYSKFALKNILISYKRKHFIKTIYPEKTIFVTLSSAQATVLKSFIPNGKCLTFPSIICEQPNILGFKGGILKVCIPGFVDHFKRDYIGFFESLLKNKTIHQNKIEIDLLGYYDGANEYFKSLINQLENINIKVTTHSEFLTPSSYDLRINESHILLGNIIVKKSKNGQLKETGTVYNMIRASRPGLFPSEFVLDSDFDGSYLSYNNFEHLTVILKDFYANPTKINKLIDNAITLSKKYQPENLIKRLE